MKTKAHFWVTAFVLAALALVAFVHPVGATPPEDMVISIKLGPEFAQPLLGSWSGKVADILDAGQAVQYWSHTGNGFKSTVSHTENVLAGADGTITLRTDANLQITYLEDGFEQYGTGSFSVVSGTGVYSGLRGHGTVSVEVSYSYVTEQVSIQMKLYGASQFPGK